MRKLFLLLIITSFCLTAKAKIITEKLEYGTERTMNNVVVLGKTVFYKDRNYIFYSTSSYDILFRKKAFKYAIIDLVDKKKYALLTDEEWKSLTDNSYETNE